MLKLVSLFVPIIGIALIFLPLIKVFKGRVSALSAKRRLVVHIALFATLVIGASITAPIAFAEEAVATVESVGSGLKYIAAALATGFSALGAGIAVAAAAPAAIGAISENSENFGKSLIFVALGEGVAIYGLLISILIING